MGIQVLFKKISLLLIALSASLSLSSQVYDYGELIHRIQTNVRTGLKDVGVLDGWVNTQSANGRWSAFSYGQLTSSNGMNTNDNHVLRVWNLAAAVSHKGHARYNDESYKQAVKKGLEGWYQSNTTDANWWYNWIYCPQQLGETLLFMREFQGYIPAVSGTEISEATIISLFKPQQVSQISARGAGANAIDIALHFVYRGLLTQDAALLEGVRDFLTPILADNIKSDGMYQDHGPQIQVSSYGYVFANGLIQLASYLSGSPAAFDIEGETIERAVHFIRETQIASIRGSQWDFSVMWRGVSRVNALNAGLNYLQKMADFIDPENAILYMNALGRIKGSQAIDSNIKEMNKHYWASDYTQHVRKGYLFTVRNVSKRTVEAETGNDENLKANYFSYGATFLSVDGSEYKNIMPYWDWCMIPGTTFPYTTSYPKRLNWGTNFGATSFVGGVSDGRYGASVLDMDKSGMKAKKSWFFFDDEVVCLGAGISDNSNRNVRTTLNQAKMQDASYSKEVGSAAEKMQSVSPNVYAHSNLLYLRNGKSAYFFPDKGNVKYTMKSQTGRWRDININGSTTVESGYVFSIWFDHGENPVDASYSYVVVPGIDTKDKAEAYDLTAIDVLSNTSSLQAVAHRGLNILQVIFHQAGSLVDGNTTYTVNAPCALMIRDGTKATVADPSQSQPSILFEMKTGDKVFRKEVVLPAEADTKGASFCYDIDLSTSLSPATSGGLFDCYPNLIYDGMLFVRSPFDRASFCKVRTQLGSLVLNCSFQDETAINLSDQPSGVYVLTLTNGDQQCNRKIVKF